MLKLISSKEVFRLIRRIAIGKSPGINRIPYKFYKLLYNIRKDTKETAKDGRDKGGREDKPPLIYYILSEIFISF